MIGLDILGADSVVGHRRGGGGGGHHRPPAPAPYPIMPYPIPMGPPYVDPYARYDTAEVELDMDALADKIADKLRRERGGSKREAVSGFRGIPGAPPPKVTTTPTTTTKPKEPKVTATPAITTAITTATEAPIEEHFFNKTVVGPVKVWHTLVGGAALIGVGLIWSSRSTSTLNKMRAHSMLTGALS